MRKELEYRKKTPKTMLNFNLNMLNKNKLMLVKFSSFFDEKNCLIINFIRFFFGNFFSSINSILIPIIHLKRKLIKIAYIFILEKKETIPEWQINRNNCD